MTPAMKAAEEALANNVRKQLDAALEAHAWGECLAYVHSAIVAADEALALIRAEGAAVSARMKAAEEALERISQFLKDWDNASNHEGLDWFYHEFKAEYEAAVAALALIRAEAAAVPADREALAL